MTHLLAFAKWCEEEGVEWWHFPDKQSERCLTRFRGALVKQRKEGELAPSTTAQRMRAVVQFYRWLLESSLLRSDRELWGERTVRRRFTDSFGLEHSIKVASTDLAIPNRSVAGALQYEDGIQPISIEAMRQILDFSSERTSLEIWLMLRLGFQSGLRIGSILDLKIRTLEKASLDPVVEWNRIAVGPGARPPVATKFGVTGNVPIHTDLLQELLAYATSTRRLKRQAMASGENRDLLFLTRFGEPYSGNECRAVNVAMSRLRKGALIAGRREFEDFHFHRTRATFATMLIRAALKYMTASAAVEFVRDACLHRDDATTLRYIKSMEEGAEMSEAADAFSQSFMGLAKHRACQ
ncbi:tyrosine-type recombinase/integrase [Pseudoxanthomonas sp. LARHCG66]